MDKPDSRGGGAELPTTDADKLKLLINVGRLVSRQLDLKPLLAEVLAQAQRLGAQRCTVWLYDQDHGELYTFLGEGLKEEFRMPLASGLAGAAAVQGKTLNVPDAYQSEHFNPEFDKLSGYHTKSVLAVPLLDHAGNLLGCFQAINRIDPAGEPLTISGEAEPVHVGVFSAEDEDLLTALAGFVAVAVENALLYEEQKRQFNSFIVTLAQSVDARDSTTSSHTMVVTGIAVALARQMGLSERVVERVRIAAILHDYGKIGVPDEVLGKAGPHDGHEKRLMRSHVTKTILILSRIAFRRDLWDIPHVAGMHHEWLDGSGYPFGLEGEDLPLEGRILAVADVFQALTQTRPYKAAMDPQEALEVCRGLTGPHIDNRTGEQRGTQLDANVVEALGEVLADHGTDPSFFERTSGWDQMLSGEAM